MNGKSSGNSEDHTSGKMDFDPNSLDSVITGLRLKAAQAEETLKDIGHETESDRLAVATLKGQISTIQELIQKLEKNNDDQWATMVMVRRSIEAMENFTEQQEAANAHRDDTLDKIALCVEQLKDSQINLVSHIERMSPKMILLSCLVSIPAAATIAVGIIFLSLWLGVPQSVAGAISQGVVKP